MTSEVSNVDISDEIRGIEWDDRFFCYTSLPVFYTAVALLTRAGV